MNGALSADAVDSERDANIITDAIFIEGEALEKVLLDAGVAECKPYTDTWDICMDKLQHFFDDRCVAMTGHLPMSYWPKLRRNRKERIAVTLCSCQVFMQNCKCEHKYFVKGHVAKPGEEPNLALCPVVRRTGRPRKHQFISKRIRCTMIA